MSGANKSLATTGDQEHVGPDTTGDNIHAKRVVPYYWDGSDWQRMGAGLVPSSYDAQDYSNSDTTHDVIDYYSGGLAGTKVATVTITYTDSTKSAISSIVKT